MAVIVPKRLLARAVDRNRSKRLMREWFRTNQSRFAGNDLLIRLTGHPETPDVIPGQLAELMSGITGPARNRSQGLPGSS